MPQNATVGLVGGLWDNGAIGAPEEPASKDGKDAFHRVPFILGEVSYSGIIPPRTNVIMNATMASRLVSWLKPAALMVLLQSGLWQTTPWLRADALGSDPAISFEVPGGSNRCQAVAFSRDLRLLATKRVSGQVEVWEVAKGNRLAQWQVGAASEAWGLLQTSPQMSFLEGGGS